MYVVWFQILIPDLDILVVARLQISRQMSNNLSFHDGPHAVRDHPRLGIEGTWRLLTFTFTSTAGRRPNLDCFKIPKITFAFL